MIEFIIPIPVSIAEVQSPKMILGNYIHTDHRLVALECDRMYGYCTITLSTHLDPIQQVYEYKISAEYADPEQEMLRRLSM